MRCGAVFRFAVESGTGAAGVLEVAGGEPPVGLAVAEGVAAVFGLGGGATGKR